MFASLFTSILLESNCAATLHEGLQFGEK